MEVEVKKKRKRRRPKDKSCFAFKRHGRCEYGDKCKFSHDINPLDDQAVQNDDIEPLRTNTSMFPMNTLSFAPEEEDLYKKTNHILNKRHIYDHIFLYGSFRRPVPYIKRYFAQFFSKDHLIISLRSNGVCVLSLSPLHPIFHNSCKLIKFTYLLFPNNIEEFEVSGKKKKPNFPNYLQKGQTLFKIEFSEKKKNNEDLNKEKIFSANFNGNLLEINKKFLDKKIKTDKNEFNLKSELIKKNHFFLIFQPKKQYLHQIQIDNMNYFDYLKYSLEEREIDMT